MWRERPYLGGIELLLLISFLYLKKKFNLHLLVCGSVSMCGWRSGDNFWKLILSYQVGSRD